MIARRRRGKRRGQQLALTYKGHGTVLRDGGVVAATFVIASVQDPAGMNPSTSPPLWPTLPVFALIGLVAALAPAYLTPPPPSFGPATDLDSARFDPPGRGES